MRSGRDCVATLENRMAAGDLDGFLNSGTEISGLSIIQKHRVSLESAPPIRERSRSDAKRSARSRPQADSRPGAKHTNHLQDLGDAALIERHHSDADAETGPRSACKSENASTRSGSSASILSTARYERRNFSFLSRSGGRTVWPDTPATR
jgi:hypothetical protein